MSDAPHQANLAASRAVYRTAWRSMLVLLGTLLVLGIAAGAVLAGSRGVWGALLGTAIAAVFSGTTVVSVGRTVGDDPIRMVSVVMGAWIVKMLVVFVALLVLSRFAFYDRAVMGVVLLLGVIGSAVLDYRAVTAARTTYVDPAGDRAADPTRDQAVDPAADRPADPPADEGHNRPSRTDPKP